VLCRAAQGVGMACAVVVGRAMVRDLYEPQHGAQVMAMGLSGLGVIALCGPPLGGWLASLGGWRAPLWAVAAVGALALAFIALRLPETLPHRNPRALHPGPLLATWWRIAGHRRFQAWTLLVSCTYGGLFTTLAASSFAYIGVLGVAPWQYGLVLGSNSLVYLAGTLVCRRWVRAVGTVTAVRRGAGCTLAAGVLLLGLAASGQASAISLLLPMWLYAFGHGIHQPCGQAEVAGPFPQHAGAAAALAGFVLAMLAFAIGLWLGTQALAQHIEPFAYSLAFWAGCTAAVAFGLLPRAVRATAAA
jgi:MFS transporter, DHA1 family, multidrug resistance protein